MFTFSTALTLYSFVSIVSSQAVYPPGCEEATFPDPDNCAAKNFFLGPDAKDSCAPYGPYPVSVIFLEPFDHTYSLSLG